jgi:putative FmdB family regulatory protein
MVRNALLPVHWHSSHSSANREANGKDGMPTYEYACKKCGEHLEVVQSFRDEPLKECPVCGGELRKVFSPVGISFKGSGFYRNDSRSSAKAAKGDGEKAPATSTSSDSSDSKSSDSKSDTKSSDGKRGDSKSGTGKKDAKPEAKTA